MTGYSYVYEGDVAFGVLSALLANVPSVLLGLAGYVLSSIAIYTISRRRGLNHPWMAWVPVLKVWLLGSLSDQYQYVVKGENKSKRKWLLALNLVVWLLSVAMVAVLIVFVVDMAGSNLYGMNERELMKEAMGMILSILGLTVPVMGVSIAFAVIRFMALYDVYRSLDPGNSVLFLVLSILFNVTEPFFLFFNRMKDKGMPPRRQPEYVPQEESHWQPQEPVQEPWETENKDYL